MTNVKIQDIKLQGMKLAQKRQTFVGEQFEKIQYNSSVACYTSDYTIKDTVKESNVDSKAESDQLNQNYVEESGLNSPD